MSNLSSSDALNVMAQTIADNRRRLGLCSGSTMLVWGYTCVAVSLLVWGGLVVFKHPAFNFLFFLIWIIGGTVTPHLLRRQREQRGAVTTIDNILSRCWAVIAWAAILLTFACLGLMLFASKDAWEVMLLYPFVIVGLMLTVQGIALQERWCTTGGIIGLTIGLALTTAVCADIELSMAWVMPTIIVGFIAMFIIPGHVLNHKYVQRCNSTN